MKIGCLLVLSTVVLGSFACGDASEPMSSVDTSLSTGGQPTSTGEFGLQLGGGSPTVNLGETVEVAVTINPSNGFSGSVNLTVEGLTPGAMAEPVTVPIAGMTTAKVKIS